MVYSRASCQTCKTRRIKCDATKPICKRCAKSKRVCLDADAIKQISFSVHIENPFASGKIKRPRGPRSSLGLAPHLDLHAQAVAYFKQYHLQALQDVPYVSTGLYECISGWIDSGRSCAMVDLALSSLALAIFSRIQHRRSAVTEASLRYHRLLRVVQERIAQLEVPIIEESNIDPCLLAVSLMSHYEGAALGLYSLEPMNSSTSLQRWSHQEGLSAILYLWKDRFTHSVPSFTVKQTRRELIKSSLLRDLSLPAWIKDGSLFGEQGPDLDYDRIWVRVVGLHHAATNLQKHGHGYADIKKLNDEACELDNAHNAWAQNIPGHCLYRRHIVTELVMFPMKHFYSSTVNSCPKPGHASAWSHYFVIGMIINSTRYKILEMWRENPSIAPIYKIQRQECLSRLEAMADNLAFSVPFCLERFQVDFGGANETQIILKIRDDIKPYLARLIVWPLLVACKVDGLASKQKTWFKSELASVVNIMGGIIFT